MKIACQEGMVPGRSLSEKLDKLARWGYEGIEFGGGGILDRVEEIKKATAGHQVKPSTICAGYKGCLLDTSPSERNQAMEDIKRLLGAAGEIGAVGLIMVPIFGGPRLPDLSPLMNAQALEAELLLNLLEPMGQYAAESGTCVLLEPLNRYETHFVRQLEQGTSFCEKIGNPRLKIMADFFHMSIEERDIPASIEKAGSYVAHVHLADSTRLLPGYGHTDFKSGFAALKKVGFGNYMALECGIPGNPDEELPKCARYLKSCM
ncbi:MAG: sugar phosphate isomerase/epimerase [Armatimonadetes bacterium]|nr:sugar phosphate isomerase/epimerase [Armatimonadota bacterium]